MNGFALAPTSARDRYRDKASRGERLFFPVQLDGHRLTAVIDTGSQVTVLATASARALGVTEEQLSRGRSVTTQGVAGEPLSARVHRFARLDIGSLIIRNPEPSQPGLAARPA